MKTCLSDASGRWTTGNPRAGQAAAAFLLAGSAAVHVAAFRPYEPSGREEVYARAAAALALRPEEAVAAPEIGSGCTCSV